MYDAPFVAAALFAVSALALLILLGVLQAQFIRRLRVHHADVWRSLGEPAILPGLSQKRWAVSSRMNRYFYVRDFESIADPDTRRLAERIWALRRMFLRYALIGGTTLIVLIVFVRWRTV